MYISECAFCSIGNGKLTDTTNEQGQALEAEMRRYANYEHFTTERNYRLGKLFRKKGSSLLEHDLSILCKFFWLTNEAGSCPSGCDVIVCKLGPLHPKRLSLLESTHYGNQFDERLNSFTKFMRI